MIILSLFHLLLSASILLLSIGEHPYSTVASRTSFTCVILEEVTTRVEDFYE